jgi:hypothetical protein
VKRLRPLRPKDWSSIPGGDLGFSFYATYTPAVGPSQCRLLWVPGTLIPVVKRPVSQDDHSLTYVVMVRCVASTGTLFLHLVECSEKLPDVYGCRNGNYLVLLVTTGAAVAQLVEALRYKPEGRGFDSEWCHWNFSLT